MKKEGNCMEKNLQEFYEEWAIIGEKDDYWKAYESTRARDDNETVEGEVVTEQVRGKKKKMSLGDAKAPMEWIGTAMGYLKDIDMNQLQNQITNVGATIASIQSVIDQFRHPAGSARSEARMPKSQTPPTFKQED